MAQCIETFQLAYDGRPSVYHGTGSKEDGRAWEDANNHIQNKAEYWRYGNFQ